LASEIKFALPDSWYHSVPYPGQYPTMFVVLILALQCIFMSVSD